MGAPRRARALRLLGCLLVVYSLGPPAALAAGPSNPFAPFQQTTPPTVSSTQTPALQLTTTTSSGGNLSGSSAIAIAVGAFLVLGGISLFIWRDARRHAHVRRRPAPAMSAGPSGRPGSKREKPRKLSPAERRRRKRGRAR